MPYVILNLSSNMTIGQILMYLWRQYKIPISIRSAINTSPMLTETISTTLIDCRTSHECDLVVKPSMYCPLIMYDIRPPTYSKNTNLGCQGYWSDVTETDKHEIYLPTISSQVWPGKQTWVDMIRSIENNFHGQEAHWSNFRGMSPSRLVPDEFVGSAEYSDIDVTGNKICWPEGYIEHYILNHNVMPTKLMFEYVIWKYNQMIF